MTEDDTTPEPTPEPVKKLSGSRVKNSVSRLSKDELAALNDSSIRAAVEAARGDDRAVPRRSPEPPPSDPYVVGNGNTDTIILSAIIYKNELSRKSLSVLHVQRRLGEWGYGEAVVDHPGYYGDLTEGAMRAFQGAQGLEVTGRADAATLTLLFKSDPNVELAL